MFENPDKSALDHVMVWFNRTLPIEHWPRFLSPYGVTRPHCIKLISVKKLAPDCGIGLKKINCNQYIDTLILHLSPPHTYGIAHLITRTDSSIDSCWCPTTCFYLHTANALYVRSYTPKAKHRLSVPGYRVHHEPSPLYHIRMYFGT